MEKTTIQINIETLRRLKSLKSFDSQSYDDLINNIINNSEEIILDEEEIREIKNGLDDVKNGDLYSIESVAKEFGITLS